MYISVCKIYFNKFGGEIFIVYVLFLLFISFKNNVFNFYNENNIVV